MPVRHAGKGKQAAAVEALGVRRVEARADLFDHAAGHADVRRAPVGEANIRKQGRSVVHGRCSLVVVLLDITLSGTPARGPVIVRLQGEGPEMSAAPDISGHYSQGGLLARLEASLREDGADPASPTLEELAPYDHFHGRGLEATEDMANRLPVSAADRILDIGSGLGGPARYMARRFGCRVAGIDLTAEFCEVARLLTARLGLEDRVSFRQGDALALPFDDEAFDGAYSMNVSMNIADKRALYRGIRRVLKPGAWLCPVRGRAGAGRRARLPASLGGHRRLELPRHAGGHPRGA